MELRKASPGFRGELIALGRQARGLTQQELATEAGVTQGLVSFVEDGRRTATNEQTAVFAKILRFPIEFFSQDDIIMGTGVGELFHRRRKSISAKDLARVHAWINIKTFANRRLLRAVDWPAENVPTWTLGVDVESEELAAQTLRAQWYVPSGPIRSVSDLIDRSGMMTVPTPFPTQEIDAIGQWPADLPPLIFSNTQTSQDRLRFTLMHEIGHLVLHQRSALMTVSDQIEDEANKFASAFLMPSGDIKTDLKRLTVAKLGDLKRIWRVSMAALLMRAKQLETITPAEEKALWVELSRNGWRKREPPQLDVFGEETGKLYRELILLHRKDLGYTESALGTLVNLQEVDDVRTWIVPPTPGPRLVS